MVRRVRHTDSLRVLCGGALLLVWPWCTGTLWASEAGLAGRGVGSINLFAAAAVTGDSYVVVGDRGRIFLSTDGARTWRRVESGTAQPLVSVRFVDPAHGWACGQAGTILSTANGGAEWVLQRSGVESYLFALDFVDRGHGLAVGADSTVLKTSDGGLTWQRCTLAPGPAGSAMEEALGEQEELNLFAVAMVDQRRACIAGEKGKIFYTEDGGSRWSEAASPLYDKEMQQGRILYSLAYDGGVFYGCGIDGTLVFSRDGGKTWTEGTLGSGRPELYAIGILGGVGYAVGSGGSVFKTSDGGRTWGEVGVPERVRQWWLSGVTLSREGAGPRIAGLIVGQNGAVGRIEGETIRW
jgi:photosystem II stability/assembly factor-like uncharacterized protein